MGLTNFPDGITSFGAPVFPSQQGGFAKTLFVGAAAAGYNTGVDGESYDAPLPTLKAALDANKVDSQNRGTLIVVRRGHTESINAADYFSAIGTKTNVVIKCEGHSTDRPAFTWTTATSTWLWDTAGIVLENARLFLAGADAAGSALTVAAPITISAAGCGIYGCTIRFGFDADQIVTIGITTTAAADDLTFVGNHCSAETAAECTTFMDLIGCDRLRMSGNYIAGATSNVAVGIVRFATTASLNIVLEKNTYINRKALSTCAVTGLAGVSGVSWQEHFAYLNTTSLTPWLTSTGIMTFHRPTVTNTAGETGTEVVGTVSA